MKRAKKLLSCVLAILMVFTIIPIAHAEENITYEVGDTIEFGSYPQSKVTDETLIAELNALDLKWISFGYYSGTGATYYNGDQTYKGVSSDYMRYADVVYNGDKYRAVIFDDYRPFNTYHRKVAEYTYQDTNGYEPDVVYWFNYEPLKWTLVDVNGLIICNNVIDAQAYTNDILYTIGQGRNHYFADSDYKIPANDFLYSSLCSWLNTEFANCSFNNKDKIYIKDTEIVGEGKSNNGVGYNNYSSGYSKVFCLSTEEYKTYKPERVVSTDYALINGEDGSVVYAGWWSRTPYSLEYEQNQALVVNRNNVTEYGDISRVNGVRPTITLDLTKYTCTHEWESTTTATCTQPGESTYTCNLCGSSYTEEVPATGHTYISEITTVPTYTSYGTKIFTCENCGDTYTEIIPRLGFVFGDVLQLGSYPQTKVEDKTLIAELNALTPDWSDWTSYGYYDGSNNYGTMVQGDWMKYTDVTYDNNRYRAVRFSKYRPYQTMCYSGTTYSTQDDNGYSTNTVYWFKFEPVNWKVVDATTGLIVCETILDAQPFSNTQYYFTDEYYSDPLHTNYASDYEASSVRKWLNNEFYNTVFMDSEKGEIISTKLNNDGYYTLRGTTGYEKLDSKETNDMIFLLSYTDMINAVYGFDSDDNNKDLTRFADSSDYAKSQGLSPDGLWLRTPGHNSKNACNVYSSGAISSGLGTADVTLGIRPAMTVDLIDLASCEHKWSEITTTATCTKSGETTYTCEICLVPRTEETLATGHEYTSEITTEPTHLTEGVKTFTCKCGDTYTEPVAKLEGHTYTSEVTKEATHLEEGETTYTCACGDSYTEAIAKLKDHTYTSEVTTEPTHLTEGVKTFTCACGDSYTEPVAKLKDHTYTSEVTKEATHLTEGVKTFTCACGDSYTEPVAKLKDHTYTSEVTKEATHLAEGETTYTCKCGDTYTEPVAKLEDHTYEKVVTEPTCTSKGYTTYTCECGDSYVDNYVGTKEHSYSSSVTTPATHTKEGILTHTCSSCGDTYTAPIAKTPEHAYTNSYVVEPTCEKEGYTAHVCDCGDIIKDNYTEKTGHSYNGRVCEDCGKNCSCMCHYSGFMSFIWKIINFFYKLFRVNKVCACGIAHY